MSIPHPILEQFHAYLASVRSESTAVKYSQAAGKFVEFCVANKLPLQKLPPGVLSAFSQYLTFNQLAPSSVHTHTAGAKKFLKWLQQRGFIERTPFDAPDLPRITQELPNALGEADILKFLRLASSQHEPQRTAMMILPFCGLRSDELVHLDLRSIARVDAPDNEGVKRPHICFTIRGKGGDVRVVPLLSDGKHILIQYLVGYRSKVADDRWLFPLTDGSPIATRTLRHYFKHIRERVDIGGKRLTPHTMRRTYATALWRAGVDVPTLTSIMGHKSVQTTLSHYLEVQPVDLAGAVGRSGAALISKGVYADKVHVAGVEVSTFLSNLPKVESL
jgi:integrase/recombinase XerD